MPNDYFENIKKALSNPLDDIKKSMLTERLPQTPIFVPPTNENWASEFHERLVTWINEFENSLDEEHEVGIRLVSFGQVLTFHLLDIGYWNPSLISFKGLTENNEPVELIQHVSQISILLQKVKRLNPEEPKRKIGFSNAERNDKD